MKRAEPNSRNCWIGVASREHVLAAVHGKFCQLSHGKEAPVRRLKASDAIIFYSPRKSMAAGEILQAFTAAGRIVDDAPYQIEQSDTFKPFRRTTHYFKSRQASIHPLLEDLRFTRGRHNWGIAVRRGVFRINSEDFKTIAGAMGIEHHAAD